MSAADEAFQALFFGDGAWLGLLLFLAIMLALFLKSEYTGALILPISLFLGLEYVSHDMGWHAIIMFFFSIFILIYMMKKIKSD